MHIHKIVTSALTSLFLALVLVQYPVGIAQVRAADASTDQYNAKLAEIEALKAKLAETQGQVATLSQAVGYLNTKQTLTRKQIEATQFQIDLLQKDIESLGGKITFLEGSLNTTTASYIKTVAASYKERNVDILPILLSQESASTLLARYKYLKVSQQYRQDLLIKTTQAKLAYDAEKSQKEKKQKDISSLKEKFVKQQQDLAEQQQAKELLLKQTKNSEATYQRLLAQATAELDSFRGFSSSKAGGLLPPQNSPDGWYFSQRDERWGNMCIGNSCGTRNSATIYEVGCLLTDLAMVKKKYGENVTPVTIAGNSSYFFSTTAYMLQPWTAPGGYHWERTGYDKSRIDGALADGRPVIVHLRINTRDGHFVVLKSGSNGDYTMHDPWEGYDKKFSSYYGISQIDSIAVLTHN